jgi:hypothetical protein
MFVRGGVLRFKDELTGGMVEGDIEADFDKCFL